MNFKKVGEMVYSHEKLLENLGGGKEGKEHQHNIHVAWRYQEMKHEAEPIETGAKSIDDLISAVSTFINIRIKPHRISIRNRAERAREVRRPGTGMARMDGVEKESIQTFMRTKTLLEQLKREGILT
jgi:hypothetical protein